MNKGVGLPQQYASRNNACSVQLRSVFDHGDNPPLLIVDLTPRQMAPHANAEQAEQGPGNVAIPFQKRVKTSVYKGNSLFNAKIFLCCVVVAVDPNSTVEPWILLSFASW